MATFVLMFAYEVLSVKVLFPRIEKITRAKVGIPIQIFSSAQRFMLVFCGHSGDSPNGAFAV